MCLTASRVPPHCAAALHKGSPRAPARPAPASITVRKSRYDLGKSFFTNITPGYQLYPTVLLLPWRDASAPNDYFLLFYTCRTGQARAACGWAWGCLHWRRPRAACGARRGLADGANPASGQRRVGASRSHHITPAPRRSCASPVTATSCPCGTCPAWSRR